MQTTFNSRHLLGNRDCLRTMQYLTDLSLTLYSEVDGWSMCKNSTERTSLCLTQKRNCGEHKGLLSF